MEREIITDVYEKGPTSSACIFVICWIRVTSPKSNARRIVKRDADISLDTIKRQAAATINRANSYSTILQYATLDALTNLNNRRQFEIRLGQEISITKRQGKPLCAMMIDIDFFKSVNDTHGHAAGDEVLRTVAGIIKEHLRESDIPSRYGGEEFAVLLPFTKLEEAKITLEEETWLLCG